MLTASGLTAQKNGGNVLRSDDTETFIKFTLDDYEFREVKTNAGLAKLISADKLSAMQEKGSPALLKLSRAIIIPDFNKNEIKVIDAKYTDIENVLIAPSKGRILRTVDPATVPYEYGEIYKKDDFFPGKLADMNEPFIERDYRGQVVNIYPFQYNPVTKTLRVYSEITVSVKNTDQRGINEYTYARKSQGISREFAQIYSNHFLNYDKERYTPLEEEGNMLIICYDDWVDLMTPFVKWKNTIGRPTEIVSLTTAGGNAAGIKSYVENYYNTKGLTYLLLVGDAAQIPTNSGGGLGGDSDNAYAYILGNDHYLDFFVGRFSAETEADVNTQVARVLEYENGSTLTEGWLNKVLGVTSKQGGSGGDDGESDFEHYRNMATDLLGYTYDTSIEMFDGSQGGNDASGNPTPEMVGNAIDNGVGLICYTGHGDITQWVSSEFSNSDVNNLSNVGKLPFIWSVACVNGNFVNYTCFGESWLRATHNGQPTGAMAIMASTINQSWAPPMKGQDEMVDILTESYPNNIKRTFGGLSINGCHAMNDKYSDFAMTDTWTCFGDPSLLVRTDNTSEMTVAHADAIIYGQNKLNVSVDCENALATLSKNGEIKGSGKVQNGQVEITAENIQPGDVLTLAVVGYNKVTYINEGVPVVAPDGPFIMITEIENEVTYGQSVDLAVKLKNIGTEQADNVEATVTVDAQYGTITSPTNNYGDIAVDAETENSSTGIFNLTANDNLTNKSVIPVTITITSGENTWTYEKNLKVLAPEIKITEFTIDDSMAGTVNGKLDPGETVNFEVTLKNEGAASVTKVVSSLVTTDSELVINTSSVTEETLTLAPGESYKAIFEVTTPAETPQGTEVAFTNNVATGASGQYTVTKEFSLTIGIIPEYCSSQGTNTTGGMIKELKFGDIINNTENACTGYTDFTENEELIKEFMLGAQYDISLASGSCGYQIYEKGAKVFIDWNYDGDFNDAGEEVFSVPTSSTNWTATETITIPADAPLGPKYMRIVLQETSSLSSITPCGNYYWGETEDYKIILVAPTAPEVEFEANTTTTLETDVVSFTDLSKKVPTEWEWTITPGTEDTDFMFVEGTSSTSQNPKVKFMTVGTYSVKLEATNFVGTSEITKDNYLTIQELTEVPVANFEADNSLINKDEIVHFTDLSTNVPSSWTWTITPGTEGTEFEFMEGTNANSRNPIVKFKKPDIYSVSLVANNKIGASEEELKEDMIEVLNIIYMANQEVTLCSGAFYDTGGKDDNYSQNESRIMIFRPESEGKLLNFNFTEFEVESKGGGGCFDVLKVYDGSNIASPLIGEFCGETVPAELQNLTASNSEGAITFKFSSDASQNKSGWAATVSCVDAEYYTVTFNVKSGTTPVIGASVTLGEQTLQTDDNGQAVFSNILKKYYTYTVTADNFNNYNGSVDLLEDKVIEVDMGEPVGINDIKDINTFSIVPNPTNGMVVLNVKGKGKIQFTVFNIAGQIVHKQTFKASNYILNTSLDLSKLQPGIYPVQVRVDGKVFFQKLIIK